MGDAVERGCAVLKHSIQQGLGQQETEGLERYRHCLTSYKNKQNPGAQEEKNIDLNVRKGNNSLKIQE